MLVRGALVLALAFPSIVAALPINVLDTQYTTHVRTEPYSGGEYVRETVSFDPISDASSQVGELPIGAHYFAHAIATADLFSIGVETSSRNARANAESQASVTFTPVHTGSALLAVDATLVFEFFTEGALRLLDSTLGEEVWSWGWLYRTLGNIDGLSATKEATLFDGHVYVLDMFTRSAAADDRQVSTMLFTGLEVESVPEPETFLLMLPALAALLLRRRRMT